MLVINDLHIGATRQGGTTPQSQQALKDFLRDSLARLIEGSDGHVVVNGDLLDNFTIDVSEVIKTYEIFSDWLFESKGKLTLIAGNHDHSAKGAKVSSFQLLCHFLQARFQDQVFVIDHTCGLTEVEGSAWAISHCMNQTLFDVEIEKALTKPESAKYLLLHANYKNGFAENSDHSLNLCDDQVGNLMRAGWTVVLAHEHIGYELRGGRVIVVGNQIPSSISDCIGEKSKRALIIDESGHRFVETWNAKGAYIETDWQHLDVGNADFIRVVGEATAAQAADVVGVISKLRQNINAFVITNAVKIEGNEMLSEMTLDSVENIRAYDVMEAILKALTEEEGEIVKGLLNVS